MPPQPLLLFLLLLLLLPISFHASNAGSSGGGGGTHSASIRLELLRRPAQPGLSPSERAQALFRRDRLRQQVIHHRIAERRRRHHPGRRAFDVSQRSAPTQAPGADQSSFSMPLNSAVYAGAAEYFVRFLLGTPAQRFLLVVDTGSDLTWAKCRRRNATTTTPLPASASHVFRPEASTSFRSIPCSSTACKLSLPFSLTACPTPASPCEYDYRYGDGSAARGDYAYESATVVLSNTHRAKLRGLIVGCTTSTVGSTFQSPGGVLGIGYSNISFASSAAARFGGRFSYCLVDHLSPRNVSSFLTFGPNPAVRTPHTRETPLLLDLEPFYGVRVTGVSVDEELLPIPERVWDSAAGGGAILDSGTSLMQLSRPAYEVVTAALSRRLAGVPRVAMDPFEYCYNWTSMARMREEELPRLELHLAGEARLIPPAKSYVIDAADGVKCLGFAAAPWPGVSTLGNILQQEHLWEFDTTNRRVRFKRSTCI